MLPWILCLILFISTSYFGYQAYRFAKMILNIQDALEDSLEVMNSRIASISKVLEIPLFYDSPEVRRVHGDLKSSKDAILKVAQTFSSIEEQKVDDEEEQQ